MARTGRPPMEIDYKLAFELARIQCTDTECAAVLGFSSGGFAERKKRDEELQSALKNGREDGKMSLRRQQWNLAKQGNPTMCIWLGKQYLGQTDKSDVVTEDRTPRGELADKSIDELEKMADLKVVEGGKA